jgi:hypothetical protein
MPNNKECAHKSKIKKLADDALAALKKANPQPELDPNLKDVQTNLDAIAMDVHH